MKKSTYQKITDKKQLAHDRTIGRYCASQQIPMKKLNLVDQQIFAFPSIKKSP